MSERTFDNGRQDRDRRGNQNSFRNNKRNRKVGMRDGNGGRGNRKDNNYNNRGRSNGGGRNWSADNGGSNWTADNVGSNWTPYPHKEQSRFQKFRESNLKYKGTRDMRDYDRKNFENNQAPMTQQQNTNSGQQSVISNGMMNGAQSMKQTIVKDLTDDNGILRTSNAVNMPETTLTELRKEDKLPLRLPMESIESQMPKIKIEKVDETESKTQVKSQSEVQHKSQQNGSSSRSSSSDDETEAPKQKKKAPKADDNKNLVKLKTEDKAKNTAVSSSEEEDDSSEATTSSSEEQMPPQKVAAIKVKKSKSKAKSERKHNYDEDVMCLGKIKTKISLDDEEPDSDAASSKSKKINKSCMLCDKQGHTSVECQMICKNCSKPYHNLKKCPQPPNLAVMMQSFMEFLMQQMAKFNPQAGFPIEQNLRTSCANFENAAPSQPVVPASPSISSTLSKRKRSQIAAKAMESAIKKTAKKGRYQKSKKDVVSEEASSVSQSESETSSDSSEPASATHDKRTSKVTKSDSVFVNSFPGQLAMPGYSGLPTYGGAAAAFNPMLPMLNQIMQNGYPVHAAFNFKQ